MKIEVKGLSTLREKLLGLPDRLSKKYVVKAFKAGANVVKDAAQDAAPHKSGAGAGGIHINTSTAGGVVTATISNNRDQFYLYFQEKGWNTNTHGRASGKGKGSVHVPAPHPDFMKNALENNASEVTNICADTLRQELETNERVR